MKKKKIPEIMNTRPKVSIYIASSIDGYIARKDGNLDWLHYGHTGDEDYGFKKFTSTIDAVVMGRNTYEVVSGFDEQLKIMNSQRAARELDLRIGSARSSRAMMTFSRTGL
jgi:dihydrofolate reductase